MKYELTQHAKDVIESRDIKTEWIESVMNDPSAHLLISSTEEHFFKSIGEASDRCLKVVVNPATFKVITTYFDRNMRKKGCKNED